MTTPAAQTPQAPGSVFLAWTPSDTADLTRGVCRAVWVGGAGNLAVVDVEGTSTTFVGVAAGTMLPIMAVRIKSTGTTATNIVAVY